MNNLGYNGLSELPKRIKLLWKSDINSTISSKDVSIKETTLSAGRVAYVAEHGTGAERLRNCAQCFVNRDSSADIRVIRIYKDRKRDDSAFEKWTDQVLSLLHEITSSVQTRTLKFEEPTLKYVRRHLEKVLSSHQSLSAFVDDASVQIIFLANDKDIVEDIANSLDGQKFSVSKEEGETENEKLVLKSCVDDLKSFPVGLEYEKGVLRVTGLRSDVSDVIAEVKRRKDNYFVQRKTVSREIIQLFKNKNVIDYVYERIKDNMATDTMPWWEIDGGFLSVVCSSGVLAVTLLRVITSSFEFWHCPGVDEKVFLSEVWKDYIECLDVGFVGKYLIEYQAKNQTLCVSGTGDILGRVVRHVEQFFKRYRLRVEAVSVNPLICSFVLNCNKAKLERDLEGEFVVIYPGQNKSQIKVSSTEEGLKRLRQMLTDVYVSRYGITKESYACFLQKIEADNKADDFLKYSEIPAMVSLRRNRVQLNIVMTKIEDLKVDVIVNSAGSKFAPMLGLGTAARALGQKVGSESIREIRKQYPDGIEFGEFVEGDAGQMSCKKIYYVTFKHYKEKEFQEQVKTLRNVMRKCLDRADETGFKSISFPALCTGNLCYPVEDVAEAMFDVATDFIQAMPASINEIVFAIFPSNIKVWQAFKAEKSRRMRTNDDACRKKIPLLEQPTYPLIWYVDVIVESSSHRRIAKQKLVDQLLQHMPIGGSVVKMPVS